MRRTRLLLAMACTLLFLAMALKPLLLAIPQPPPATEAGSFDTERAIARLQRILGDEHPHPVDSSANDAVRERLLAELRSMGLTPVVTDETGCNGVGRSRVVGCARVRNLRATIGPRSGPHLLLASHYDSSPVGPGAADDGIGVAVMLEVAALLKGRRLERPVTFLFDEGEELQLNGARAFLRSDPLAAQVDRAINLEARGVTGPAIMFETSRPNGGAIDWLRRAAWRPVANSLTADFYALLPNDTDVTVFKDRSWTILNFAIIGNESRYHSPGDRVASLDPRSVRHMGMQVLRAAEAGTGSLGEASGERLYADVIGRALVSFPLAPGIAFLALLLVTAIWLGWRRGRALGRPVATILAALAGAGVVSFAAQAGVALLRPGEFWRAHPWTMSAAIDLVALAACLAALVRIGSVARREELRIAFWLLFLAIGGVLCLIAPGAAIFFLLPAVPAVLGLLAARRFAAAGAVGALLACLLLFLAWAPLLHLSEMLLDFGSAWLFAVIAAILLLPPLIELKPLIDREQSGWPDALVGLVAVCAWATLLLLPAYSLDRKQDFSIFHVREGRGARWMVLNDGAALPAVFGSFRPGVKVPWMRRRHWAAPAPLLPVPGPRVERIREWPHPLGRRVRIRLHAAGNDWLVLRTDPAIPLVAVRIGDKVTRFGKGRAEDPFYLRCNGRSCDGLVLDLLVGGPRVQAAQLIGFRAGLPGAAAPLVAARPATAAPHYLPDATVSVVPVIL